ncbi:5-oxoprolinase subunit C family protein [Brucella cytisi]|uniref:5-oxoprolinase subunit C family protein n=1 Tax=Brucella cytisi TaxID=407152 RepID=UPI0035DB9D1C
MAKIVIDVPGLSTTVQDVGRGGHQGLGVPLSGAMDRLALAAANGLVGNLPDAAALEISYAGPTLKVRENSVRMALVGGDACFKFHDGRIFQANQSVIAHDGDTVIVQASRTMPFAILAIAGRLDLPETLGSRSTYVRGAFGGFEGRALKSGDILAVAAADDSATDMELAGNIPYGDGPIGVLLGPQADYFDAANIAQFLLSEYEVTTDSDRMGMRLTGQPLQHARGYDIVTDGVVNGSIQVPGNGLPMILLSDRQTVGGYPKIGTVVSSDLPRLAQLRPGHKMRFQALSLEEAIAARRAQAKRMDMLMRNVRPVGRAGWVNIQRLYTDNLISGVADFGGE